MVNKSVIGILMLSVLMFSLVAGAGYNIVVPGDAAVTPGGSTSTGATRVANNTATDTNDTVNDTADDSDADVDDSVGVVGEAVDFIKNIGWKSVVLVLVSLLVIVGVVWYFLADKRKGYVEIKVKKKK